jgi:hypothetical protein
VAVPPALVESDPATRTPAPRRAAPPTRRCPLRACGTGADPSSTACHAAANIHDRRGVRRPPPQPAALTRSAAHGCGRHPGRPRGNATLRGITRRGRTAPSRIHVGHGVSLTFGSTARPAADAQRSVAATSVGNPEFHRGGTRRRGRQIGCRSRPWRRRSQTPAHNPASPCTDATRRVFLRRVGTPRPVADHLGRGPPSLRRQVQMRPYRQAPGDAPTGAAAERSSGMTTRGPSLNERGA